MPFVADISRLKDCYNVTMFACRPPQIGSVQVTVAYLPENLEVFLFDAQQLAVLASDDRRMARTVVQYRFAERSAHAERAQSHRVLPDNVQMYRATVFFQPNQAYFFRKTKLRVL